MGKDFGTGVEILDPGLITAIELLEQQIPGSSGSVAFPSEHIDSDLRNCALASLSNDLMLLGEVLLSTQGNLTYRRGSKAHYEALTQLEAFGFTVAKIVQDHFEKNCGCKPAEQGK